MITIILALFAALAVGFSIMFAYADTNGWRYLPRRMRRALIDFGALKSLFRSWSVKLGSEWGRVAAPALPPLANPDINPQAEQALPFRNATLERVEELGPESTTLTAGIQRFDRTVEGSGFIFGINLFVDAIAAANVAVVAYNEDAPWNSLESVVFRDVNGELINLEGYDLFLVNLMMRQYAGRFIDQSTDAELYRLLTGAGATGGSFRFFLRVPIATNRRDLLGIVGNQDRAQKYSLRSDLNASALLYSTPPTNLPAVTIQKFYENYAVPLPQTAAGVAQEIVPRDFGKLHFLTATLSESAPLGGSTVNHYIKRLGNTTRALILVFRMNGSRANAEINHATNIAFKVGEDTIYRESYQYRRMRMHEHYGFDFPAGVLVYESMHDFGPFAGFEMGDDYFHTQALVNAQLQITYPAAFGSTGNTLRIITDDLQDAGLAQR